MFQAKVDVHAHFIPEEYREALIAAGQDRPEPNSALGHRSAMSTAAAISAASMIMYPAMTSLSSHALDVDGLLWAAVKEALTGHQYLNIVIKGKGQTGDAFSSD